MATEKRNDVSNGEDDEQQEEEQKMEQFFALIRNFQEARNKRKNELRRTEEEEEKKKKNKQNKQRQLEVDEQPLTSWVPTFEWADFTEEIEFRRPPVIFPIPYNKKEGKKLQGGDDGLDLKLTL